MPKKLLFVFLLISSCNSDKNELNCATVLCESGFNNIYINFLGESSDEDLLNNGVIDTASFEIFDEKNGEITYTIEEYPTSGTYLVVPISIEVFGQKSITLNFEGGNPFTISFNTAFLKGGECCGPYTLIEDIEVSTYTHELMEPGHLPLYITLYVPES